MVVMSAERLAGWLVERTAAAKVQTSVKPSEKKMADPLGLTKEAR
jgi:hypothetical protein